MARVALAAETFSVVPPGGGSATGGGAATGGGSTGGGTTGGGTGGGSAAVPAFFRLDVGVEYPSIVTGSNGAFHLAYATGFSRTVVYGTCTTNCGSPSGWTFVEVFNQTSVSTTGYARLTIDSGNRLHLVYERYANSMDQTVYATCAANCTTAASWTQVDLTSITGSSSAEFRGAPIVVDSAGRISFVTSDLTVNGNIYLATCGSGCTTASNWQIGSMRQGGGRTAMAARGTTLHRIMDDDNRRLRYATCASNCILPSSWTESGPLFVHDGYMPTALVLTSSGRVHVAYNQGATDSSEPMNIQMQANKLIVWQCDTNCTTDTSWSGVILGQARDGEDGIAMVQVGGALVLALTQSLTLSAGVCANNCATDTSWAFGPVDETQTMNAAVNPYMAFPCGSSAPTFAAWYPDDGVVAVNTVTGEAVFAHAAYALTTCGGTTARKPSALRVIYSP